MSACAAASRPKARRVHHQIVREGDGSGVLRRAVRRQGRGAIPIVEQLGDRELAAALDRARASVTRTVSVSPTWMTGGGLMKSIVRRPLQVSTYARAEPRLRASTTAAAPRVVFIRIGGPSAGGARTTPCPSGHSRFFLTGRAAGRR